MPGPVWECTAYPNSAWDIERAGNATPTHTILLRDILNPDVKIQIKGARDYSAQEIIKEDGIHSYRCKRL